MLPDAVAFFISDSILKTTLEGRTEIECARLATKLFSSSDVWWIQEAECSVNERAEEEVVEEEVVEEEEEEAVDEEEETRRRVECVHSCFEGCKEPTCLCEFVQIEFPIPAVVAFAQQGLQTFGEG